jgi:hypothetical protein
VIKRGTIVDASYDITATSPDDARSWEQNQGADIHGQLDPSHVGRIRGLVREVCTRVASLSSEAARRTWLTLSTDCFITYTYRASAARARLQT